MVLIVVGHFILKHGLWNGSDFISRQDVTNPDLAFLYVLFYGLCVVGVNVFILISGFFTIHLTWKTFLSYYFLCVFYNAIVFLIDTFVLEAFSVKALIKVFLVDKTVNWFFRAYFWLMLLSPLLNKALEHISVQEMRYVVVLLFFLNCISGFFFQEYNKNGYNVYNFIFLYVLGAWIRKEPWIQHLSKGKSIAAYWAFCILNVFIAILFLSRTDYSIRHVFSYNNPLIILASIGFFVFFTRLNLSNKAINVFASTVVATLFIQHIYFMLEPVFHFAITPVISFFLITPLLFILAFAIEYPRREITNKLIPKILHHIQGQQIVRNHSECR